MKKNLFTILLLVLCVFTSGAQEYFPNNESIHNKNSNYTAFTNAKILVTPTQILEKATLVIQNGKVIAVGTSVTLPKNITPINLEGKTIYPSFIDMYTDFGVEKAQIVQKSRGSQVYDSKREGYYWNEHIRSEVDAIQGFDYDKSKAEEFLRAGFGIVGTHNDDGIAQGSGALIALNTYSSESRVLSNKITNHFSFKKSVTSKQAYPTSQMGTMALLRQMYLDLDWYKKSSIRNEDLSLEALLQNEKLVQIFDAGDKLNSLRASNIGNEFNINYILKGSGNEFERLDEIKKTKAKFIIPINFPEAYDVSNPYQASNLDYADLKFWNQAPTNLKVLTDNGVEFALTTNKLKKLEDFRTNLLKAVHYGFDKTKALEALTTTPASLLGKSNEIGTLKVGSSANFLITSGDYFDKETILYENWVQGNKHTIHSMHAIDIRGNYTLTVGSQMYTWVVKGEMNKPTSEIKLANDSTKLESKLNVAENWISLIINAKDSIGNTHTRLSAYLQDRNSIVGKAILLDGTEATWKATKIGEFTKDKKEDKKEELREILPISYPNIAFGNAVLPTEETILFKNATVWTNEKEENLLETDVLIKNGKIAAIGKNLPDGGAVVVNAKGKHLTSGIIDEHSHVAISNGVNESGHNSTAEVTIQDVINSDDVNIYRQVAGGVTTSHLLHGSANPIGGRSAIVKWKWGVGPTEMLYKDQPGFIKFALGENVKQSNWGENDPSRFPQTRMGVEQVFTDYFQRAKEYDTNWKDFNSNGKKNKANAPRVDLELQTLAEIINKERFITCHSYVQSEILMLMNVANQFNFTVNTFTHILEGYKVANEIKAHGAGASTFSDWWAYKFEVNDAIPFNGPIMHKQGIVVAYNSDDAEMSRRLNQEAAKAVKYGGISEVEAWKFITLNPAKLLHIDDKVGSIKVGKDADVVLWSDNPLSIYAKVEKTIIEGVVYYDADVEESKLAAIAKDRLLIINQMLDEKNSGKKTQEPKKKEKLEYHCDTLEM
ncbi:amidohydrolase family protein [Flavobacterium sp. TMP13]|uniref:amidohydrolase family protein n=1 Tax=Flavobacterium sp. TMP13 TaxID=3425950 RepID=UPI003D77108C